MSADREDPTTDDAPNAALAHMIDEARAARPSVDWATVEARLFDECGEVRESAPSLARGRRPLAWIGGGALAAAAALAVFVARPRGEAHRNVAPPPNAQVADGRASLPQLRRGLAIHTDDSGATYALGRRVRVVVAPHSDLAVIDDGERIRLGLQAGAVAADVTPVPGGEPYAVDVGETRVAVHGTHLTVARKGSAALVAVSEGLAVLGHADASARTSGPEVKAGNVGRVIDGVIDVRADQASASRYVEQPLREGIWAAWTDELGDKPAALTPPAASATVAPLVAVSVAPSVAKSTASPTLVASKEPIVAAPAGAEVDKAFVAIDGRLREGCYRIKPSKSGAATFRLRYRLEIDAAGKVAGREFDPGIDPAKTACVKDATGAVDFPAGNPGWTAFHELVVTSAE